MVNEKRVEQKFPLMITKGPSISWEYERNEHLVRKLKRLAPERYTYHRNRIFADYADFERDVFSMAKKNNGHNGNNHNGHSHH